MMLHNCTHMATVDVKGIMCRVGRQTQLNSQVIDLLQGQLFHLCSHMVAAKSSN